MNTFPPFHDHHTHISFYSALCGTADLSSCVSTDEALKILKNRKEEIIFARGWKNNLYDIPREALDRLPPAAVCNISLHSFVINSGARDIFSKTHPEIIRNIDNQEWVEHNLNSVFSLFTDYGDTSLIPVFMDRLEKIGILEAEDMSVSSEKSSKIVTKIITAANRVVTAAAASSQIAHRGRRFLSSVSSISTPPYLLLLTYYLLLYPCSPPHGGAGGSPCG